MRVVGEPSARVPLPNDVPANDGPVIETVGASTIFAPQPPIEWTLPSLRIAPGAATMIAGTSFAGKTVLAQSIAMSKASGRDLWQLFPVTQSRVIHVDGEQGQRVTFERYQRLARAMGIDPGELEGMLEVALFPSVRLDSRGALDAYLSLCDGVGLIILDSLKAMTPTLEENSSDIRSALDMLAEVSERTGVTVIVIDHLRKASQGDLEGQTSERLRGSSAKKDALQTLFFVSGADPKGPKRVTCEKERVYGDPIAPFGFRIEDVADGHDPRWGLRVVHLDAEQMASAPDAKSSAKLAKDADRILAYMQAHSPFSGNKAALAAAIGMRTNDFYPAFSTLIADGKTVVNSDKKGAVTISTKAA